MAALWRARVVTLQTLRAATFGYNFDPTYKYSTRFLRVHSQTHFIFIFQKTSSLGVPLDRARDRKRNRAEILVKL